MTYKIENFMGSKGWCDKFIKRNKELFKKALEE